MSLISSQVYFRKRDELSTTPDGILWSSDGVVILHPLRKSVLQDLHSGHLLVENMKLLTRLTCSWSEINPDIYGRENNCGRCHKSESRTSKCTP